MRNELYQEANQALTENGAAAYASSGSECLDFFAAAGALRRESGEEIGLRFLRAFAENPDMAVKTAFFTRDVRGGLGERRVFREILRWMAWNEPDSVRKNIEYVGEYGRYDDLLVLLGTPCEDDVLPYLGQQLREDLEALRCGGRISLLGKWLPSVNASSQETVRQAKKLARAFGMSQADYRKAVSSLRAQLRLLENYLRERDYSFDYERQPSKALFQYRKAFLRNDGERYHSFLSRAREGKAALHADAVAPYELVEPYLDTRWEPETGGRSFMRSVTQEEKEALNATWNALPDFGGEENALAVVDTSGSMYCAAHPLPAAVALSLGLYFAEHNRGAFRNCFIEFSARPQLIEIKGDNFADRLRYIASFHEIANTNLEAVFDLILDTAVKNQVPQEELPSKLVLISDMEFDMCVSNHGAVPFEQAKAKYAAHGYSLPQVVFWNAASRNRQQPVTRDEQGTALVSGVTPRLFSMVAGELPSPYQLMMEILEGSRYAKIRA